MSNLKIRKGNATGIIIFVILVIAILLGVVVLNSHSDDTNSEYTSSEDANPRTCFCSFPSVLGGNAYSNLKKYDNLTYFYTPIF